MAETTLPHEMTIEEYLEFEKASPVKHEYVGGRLYAMPGTTKRHNQIAFNIARRPSALPKILPARCSSVMSRCVPRMTGAITPT